MIARVTVVADMKNEEAVTRTLSTMASYLGESHSFRNQHVVGIGYVDYEKIIPLISALKVANDTKRCRVQLDLFGEGDISEGGGT